MNRSPITIESQHGDMIHDAQLDYYGKVLATASSDNRIRIYSIENGDSSLLTEIAEHSGPVWRVSWSHPKFGSLLASCSYDGSVKIYDIQKDKSYKVIYTYTGHNSSVNVVEWGPCEYGPLLAAASSDGNVSFIYPNNDGEWTAQQIIVCRQGCNAVSWCSFRPNTKESRSVLRLAVAAGDDFIHILKCIGAPSNPWEMETKLRGHTDRVRDVAWSPFIGITSSVIASCGRDRQLIIWRQESEDTWVNTFSYHYTDMIWRLSWSVTGNVLVVSHGLNMVDMWKENLDHSWRRIRSTSSEG